MNIDSSNEDEQGFIHSKRKSELLSSLYVYPTLLSTDVMPVKYTKKKQSSIEQRQDLDSLFLLISFSSFVSSSWHNYAC